MQTNSGNEYTWVITSKQRPDKSGVYEVKYMPLDAEIVIDIWYDHAADKWIGYNSTLGSFMVCTVVPLAWRACRNIVQAKKQTNFNMTVWGNPSQSGFYLGKRMSKDKAQIVHYSADDRMWRVLDAHYGFTESADIYLWARIDGLDY